MVAAATTVRSSVFVLAVLGASLVIAGFVSSAYHGERSTLGARHFKSGSWSEEHNQLDDAIDQFRKALLFSPDEERYRLALAETLVRAGHLQEAESHLQQLADEDPNNGRINYLLGEVAEKNGKPKIAIERCQRAVYEYWPPDEIPERRRVRWHLVHLLEAANRNTEAVGELIQLYASAPNAPERAKVGFELLKYGATSEAERIFRELEASDPKDSAPHLGLGEVSFALGDFITARHEFMHVRRVSATDGEAAQWLALTNQVIELDPLLPGINAQERLRRSENLLNRVVHLVTSCSPGVTSNAVAAADFNNAQQLLKPQKHTDELADNMQASAEQLWRDRDLFCGSGHLSDRAVETALARVTGE